MEVLFPASSCAAGGIEADLRELTGLRDRPALLYLGVSIPFRRVCQIADVKYKLIACVSGCRLVEYIYLPFIIHFMVERNQQRMRTMEV